MCSFEEFSDAIARNDVASVCEFVAAGGDPYATGKCGENALHVAAASGNLCMLELLTSLGIDLYAYDKNLRTPVHWAMKFERCRATKWLLRRMLGNLSSTDAVRSLYEEWILDESNNMCV